MVSYLSLRVKKILLWKLSLYILYLYIIYFALIHSFISSLTHSHSFLNSLLKDEIHIGDYPDLKFHFHSINNNFINSS